MTSRYLNEISHDRRMARKRPDSWRAAAITAIVAIGVLAGSCPSAHANYELVGRFEKPAFQPWEEKE